MENSLLFSSLKKVTLLVNNLRDLGLEKLIQLPNIVAVGSQSTGKSLLL
jgi:hypothetical protein